MVQLTQNQRTVEARWGFWRSSGQPPCSNRLPRTVPACEVLFLLYPDRISPKATCVSCVFWHLCIPVQRVTSSSLHLPISYWNTVRRSLLSSPFSRLSKSHFFNFFFVYHIHQSSNQLGRSLLGPLQFFNVLLELKNRMKYSRCGLTSAKRNNGSPQAVELPLTDTVQDSLGLVTVKALCSLKLAVPQGPSQQGIKSPAKQLGMSPDSSICLVLLRIFSQVLFHHSLLPVCGSHVRKI